MGEDIDSNVDKDSIKDIARLAIFILEMTRTEGTLSIAKKNIPIKFTNMNKMGDFTKYNKEYVIAAKILVIAKVLISPNLSDRNFDGNAAKLMAMASVLNIIPNSNKLPLIITVKYNGI
jgi:hypothetical protein